MKQLVISKSRWGNFRGFLRL